MPAHPRIDSPARLGAAIGTRGFRRWYERELVDGFAYLVTGVLSLIMTAIAIEMLEFRATAGGLLALVAIAVVGGGLCVGSWLQFHRLLSRAEYLAEQATCGGCRTYGKFAVVSSREFADAPAGCTIDVRCRACGNEWTIA